MLIIGHRGAAGEQPENTISGIRQAIACGADMVEFDVRLTKDKIPVLAHDFHTYKMDKKINLVSGLTLDELKKRTAGSSSPIVTLEQALDECRDSIFANVEIKTLSAVRPSLDVIRSVYKTKKDRRELLLSSLNPLVLRRVRKLLPDAQLSLVHYINPLEFIAWHRMLSLSAVGFHRLHVNPVSIETAKKLGLFTYAYTVNRVEAAKRLEAKGIDAVVTDFPSKLQQKAS
jgi:glycerophosphoryl diester phosphodiesterase